jgi:hypothetical protein
MKAAAGRGGLNLRTFDDMVVAPLLVLKEPAQRHGDLPVLISVRTGLDRARVAEYVAAYLDKLRKGVAGAFLFYRLAMGKRHHMQPCRNAF